MFANSGMRVQGISTSDADGYLRLGLALDDSRNEWTATVTLLCQLNFDVARYAVMHYPYECFDSGPY